MSELLITIGIADQNIRGVLHEADINNSGKHLIVFLNGWSGYRTGPHMMFSKLATVLSSNGYSCFRFDFRGRGLSDGNWENTTYRSMYADLQNVMEYFKNEYRDISLLGICAGAKVSFMYALNPELAINRLILLSPPVLWEERNIRNVFKVMHHS